MKFEHCLLLSACIASLLIATLILIGTPMGAATAGQAQASSSPATSRMVILPARHTPRVQMLSRAPL